MIRIPTPSWLLSWVAILSACAPNDPARAPLTEIRVEYSRLPAALTTCDPEPPSPSPHSDYAALLNWIDAVRIAGDDCRRRLACVERYSHNDSCLPEEGSTNNGHSFP